MDYFLRSANTTSMSSKHYSKLNQEAYSSSSLNTCNEHLKPGELLNFSAFHPSAINNHNRLTSPNSVNIGGLSHPAGCQLSSVAQSTGDCFVATAAAATVSAATGSPSREFDQNIFDILMVEPEDLASQITFMDWPVFRRIEPFELTSCAWNTKHKLAKTPNIVQFIRRFNHTNFWVQHAVLHAATLRQRVDVLAHMIKVAKRLLDLNNINGLMAVITGLQSSPIYRLECTWNNLLKRDRNAFNALTDLLSENENRRKLRDHLSMTRLPCIPFLGLYLTDLVYIDTLHPHTGGIESSQRRNLMNNICRVISEFQQSDYSFLRNFEHIQTYLNSVRYIEELQKFAEDDNFKLSLSLEPVVLLSSSPAPTNSTVQSLTSSPLKKSTEPKIASQPKKQFASTHWLSNSADDNQWHQTSFSCESVLCNEKRRTQSGAEKQCPMTVSTVLKQTGRVVLHRKTRSDVTFSNIVKPVDDLKNKSLLDDSVLENEQDCRRSSTGSPALDSTLEPCCRMVVKNMKQSILSTFRFPGFSVTASTSGQAAAAAAGETKVKIEFEGALERKTLLRGFKNPVCMQWKKLWVCLTSPCHLMLFKPIRSSSTAIAWIFASKAAASSSALTDRASYTQKPYKCYCLTSRCMLFMLDEEEDSAETKNKNEFQLSDLRKGNVYRFRAPDDESASKWYEHLARAIRQIQRRQKPGWPAHKKSDEVQKTNITITTLTANTNNENNNNNNNNTNHKQQSKRPNDLDSRSTSSNDDNDLIYFD